MAKKWLFPILLGLGFLLSGCGLEDSVSMPTGLFMPKADINTTSLCAIEISNVKVEKPANNPNHAALIVEGSVGNYCGQLEIKMSPMNNTDEVHIIMVAEPPKDAPSTSELQTRKPVFVNMTLDTLPAGRYKLFINGKSYDTISTP